MARTLLVVTAMMAAAAVVSCVCEDWKLTTDVACENDDGFPPVCIGPCDLLGYESGRCVDKLCRCSTDAINTNQPCSESDGYPSPCVGFCMRMLNYSRARCVDDRCRCLP
ncbi:uncharacterized protein LOC126260046 [Schistocerca nitens]|uniref:uncharacterized protein LOC126260046 n=1 Tax=Schistocerca nitens TaxID=7011 RepID=UPI002119240E|nr:uncharacterized protein LOC126260046 [Schistocerca nitens]